MPASESPWIDHSYRSADNRLDLYARLYESAGRTDAPPLLLMHGLTRNSADFEGLAAHLAKHYRLIVPDQRGRGRSEYDPEPANYTPQVYAGDMFALMDDLGIETATLIGTSMGGLMAILMALAQPARVRGMVLNDVGPEVDPAGIERIKSYVGKITPPATWDEAANYVRRIAGDAFPDVTDHAVWMKFARANFIEEDGQIRASYDPAIAQGVEGDDPSAVPPDLWPIWDMLKTKPVLAIRGAISDILSAETFAEMERRHGEHYTGVEIPQRGHAPMLDEPEAVDAIRAFLNRLYSA